MVNLRQVTIALDSSDLITLTRSVENPIDVPLLQHLNTEAQLGHMAVTKVTKTKLRIGAESHFHNKSDATVQSAEKAMTIWSADIKVALDGKSDLGLGLTKATKKALPDTCSYQLMYVSVLQF